MNDTLRVIENTYGLSDTVLLAIIGAFLTISTLITNAIINARAKKAENIAATEAAKVNAKLQDVEIKIDGRLTELLSISKLEAQERGHRMGKDQEKKEEKDRKKEK